MWGSFVAKIHQGFECTLYLLLSWIHLFCRFVACFNFSLMNIFWPWPTLLSIHLTSILFPLLTLGDYSSFHLKEEFLLHSWAWLKFRPLWGSRSKDLYWNGVKHGNKNNRISFNTLVKLLLHVHWKLLCCLSLLVETLSALIIAESQLGLYYCFVPGWASVYAEVRAVKNANESQDIICHLLMNAKVVNTITSSVNDKAFLCVIAVFSTEIYHRIHEQVPLRHQTSGKWCYNCVFKANGQISTLSPV